MQAVDNQATRHTRSRYNLMAPVYDAMEGMMENGLYKAWRQELWSRVEGPEVLEIGVGTGRNIPYYPAELKVTGIDLSEKMLDRALAVADRHVEKQIELRVMDAQDLEFPSNSFDDVVGTFVFCSVPDPVLGLIEARRVARAGGRLWLLEHMLGQPPWLAGAMRAADAPIHWLMGVHIARPTVEHVEAAGWTIDRVAPLSKGAVFQTIEAHK